MTIKIAKMTYIIKKKLLQLKIMSKKNFKIINLTKQIIQESSHHALPQNIVIQI